MTPTSFSPSGYREILEDALDHGYTFSLFRDALGVRKHPCMIVRHDVDFCLELANGMAELERELGISATYFIIPDNEFYNPFSSGKASLIKNIHRMGHEIGLHYDSRSYAKSAAGYASACQEDLKRLGDLIGEPIASAAQHIPTDSPHVDVSSLVAIEAYDLRLMKRFRYVSDSSMEWRDTTPIDLIRTGVDIQFLSHPIWWLSPGTTREEKVMSIPVIAGEHLRVHCENALLSMEESLHLRNVRDREFRRERGIT